MTADLPLPDEVLAASERLSDLAPSPVVQVGERLWLKLENLQPTGSFKVRGFLNAVRALPAEELRAGIVTVSAGNAALAAAYVAARAGVPCKVVMYDSAPAAKRDGVRALGGEVLSWPREEVMAWIGQRGWEDLPQRFVHPFADLAGMAGTASLALELVEQVPDLRRVVVPVGGGGLAVGIAAGLRAAGKTATLVGAQSSGYPMWIRVFGGDKSGAPRPDTIADGTTAPYDSAMHERLAAVVDQWVQVPEGDLRRGVRELVLSHKVVPEGAGALGYAAAQMLDGAELTVAVLSGGNIDPARLAELLTG